MLFFSFRTMYPFTPMVYVETRSSAVVGEIDFEGWLAQIGTGFDAAEAAILQRAVTLARQAHGSQQRASGEPYVNHSIAVADILSHLRMDHEI